MPFNLDTSVYRNNVQMPNLAGMYLQGAQVRNAIDDRKLRTRNEKLRTKLAGLYESTGGDYRKMAGLIGSEDANTAFKLEQMANEQDRQRVAMQQAEFQQRQDKMARAGAIANSYLKNDNAFKLDQMGNLKRAFRENIGEVPRWLDEKDHYDQEVDSYLQMIAQAGQGQQGQIQGQMVPYVDEKGIERWGAADKNTGQITPSKIEGMVGTPAVGRAPQTGRYGNILYDKRDPSKGYTRLPKTAEIALKESANNRDWAQFENNLKKLDMELEKHEMTKAEKAEKKRRRKEGIDLAAQTVVEDLGRGIYVLKKNREKLITTAAGPLALIARNLPATDADKLEKFAESVKSNISIDRLQAMREASPTGGALGQVPVQQQVFLMQLLGSLDTAQMPSILEDNMKRIYNIYLDIIHGEGNGPRDGFRYKLGFDELGRPIKNGRKWKGDAEWKTSPGPIRKSSTKTNAVKSNNKSRQELLDEIF